MAFTPKEVKEFHFQVKSILESWMKLRLVLQKSFSQGPIAKEHENVFLKLKSDISRINRNLGEQLPRNLTYNSEEMMDLMKNAMTMQTLHSLPPHERTEVFDTWHRVYITMNRSLGALAMVDEGYYPKLHRKFLSTEDSGGSKGKKKGKSRGAKRK